MVQRLNFQRCSPLKVHIENDSADHFIRLRDPTRAEIHGIVPIAKHRQRIGRRGWIRGVREVEHFLQVQREDICAASANVDRLNIGESAVGQLCQVEDQIAAIEAQCVAAVSAINHTAGPRRNKRKSLE